jgi:hypothetical protein
MHFGYACQIVLSLMLVSSALNFTGTEIYDYVDMLGYYVWNLIIS